MSDARNESVQLKDSAANGFLTVSTAESSCAACHGPRTHSSPHAHTPKNVCNVENSCTLVSPLAFSGTLEHARSTWVSLRCLHVMQSSI